MVIRCFLQMEQNWPGVVSESPVTKLTSGRFLSLSAIWTDHLASEPTSLTPDIDLSFDEIVWRTNEEIITTAESNGSKPIYATVSRPNVAERAQSVGTTMNLSISSDGTVLVCNSSRLTHPAEVFVVQLNEQFLRSKAPGVNLSKMNDRLLAELALPTANSSVTVKGSDDDPMQMWLLTPPGYDGIEEMAAGVSGSWRTSGSLVGQLELPLESADLGGSGLCRCRAQSTRQYRFRAEVH